MSTAGPAAAVDSFMNQSAERTAIEEEEYEYVDKSSKDGYNQRGETDGQSQL